MAHERLIERLYAKEERPLMARLVAGPLRGLNEARQIAVLHEGARLTDKNPEQSLDYMTSFIRAIGGLDSDADQFNDFFMSGAGGWVDPFPVVDAPPSAQYEDAINSLAEESRAGARAFADKHHAPGLEDRVRATILESGNTDKLVANGKMSLEDARAHLARVATLGVPAEQAEALKTWFATLPPEDEPVVEDRNGDINQLVEIRSEVLESVLTRATQPTAPPAVDPVAAAQADVAKYETMMREDPRTYWGSNAHQQGYRDALTVIYPDTSAAAE
jgi:hypothetical protein